MMKDGIIKNKYKLHDSIVYFDKNEKNAMGNKYLISLGYDSKA